MLLIAVNKIAAPVLLVCSVWPGALHRCAADDGIPDGVDVEAVDVAEQERILCDIQRQGFKPQLPHAKARLSYGSLEMPAMIRVRGSRALMTRLVLCKGWYCIWLIASQNVLTRKRMMCCVPGHRQPRHGGSGQQQVLRDRLGRAQGTRRELRQSRSGSHLWHVIQRHFVLH